MIRPILFLVFITFLKDSECWDNDYDKELRKECADGEHFYRIRSTHNNGKEDRKWEFSCREGFVSTDCEWTTDYANDWDKAMDYTCPDNRIITGVYSKHSNSKEDRRWKYKCCELNTKAGINCKKTDYINDWDKSMDYTVPTGKAVVGFLSWHKNSKEDRRWKVKLCDFATCIATKMTILDNIQPNKIGERAVGISSSQGCSSSVNYATNLGSTSSVTESYSFTTSKASTFTWDTTISVEATASASFLGSGGSVTVGVSQSFGGSLEWSTSETVETSVGTDSSSATTMTYTGPGAVLLMADVQEYEFDTSNVNVEYEISCDDGTTFSERSTVSLTADTFGQTHYTQKFGSFNDGKCTTSTNTCIRNVNGALALEPSLVTAQFEACFSNGVGSVE